MLGLAADADAIPTLTIPSIKQDIAAAVIAIFLIILYPFSCPVGFGRLFLTVWVFIGTSEAGWTLLEVNFTWERPITAVT
jgi:hypothetical protein